MRGKMVILVRHPEPIEMEDNPTELREGELVLETPVPNDAALQFIGRIRTPALRGLEAYEFVDLLYWLDRSRRDLVLQNPARRELFGTFALRSPNRPNPIGLAHAKLVRIVGNVVVVRGLDCLDGTPLVDLKPDTCAFSPKAPPKPGLDV